MFPIMSMSAFIHPLVSAWLECPNKLPVEEKKGIECKECGEKEQTLKSRNGPTHGLILLSLRDRTLCTSMFLPLWDSSSFWIHNTSSFSYSFILHIHSDYRWSKWQRIRISVFLLQYIISCWIETYPDNDWNNTRLPRLNLKCNIGPRANTPDMTMIQPMVLRIMKWRI